METVTLEEMLAARDRRVARQQALLRQYEVPLVYLTLNIPGPVKLPHGVEQGFSLARRRVEVALAEKGYIVRYIWSAVEKTGCEACWSVAAPDFDLKTVMVALEEADPFGRLLDLDVLSLSGEKLARAVPRRCLLCGQPAPICARSRAHSVTQMLRKIETILEETLS